jgi:membrane associated rhomboid family serine protease
MTPAPVGLRCPEHSGKPQGMKKVTAAAERAATGRGSRSVAPVTMLLIGINVGVYLAELALGGTIDGQGNWIYEHGALLANGAYHFGGAELVSGAPGAVAPGAHMAGVTHGEWWRLMTAAFLHYGPIHLGLNMLALYWLGPALEQIIGRWRYLLLYLVAGLAGSAGALWLSPNDITVGASGAIFGVLGALLVLERQGMISSGGQILMLIILNLLFTVAVPGISIGGHIGGLLAGGVTMLAFTRFRRSTELSLASALALGVLAVAVAYVVV